MFLLFLFKPKEHCSKPKEHLSDKCPVCNRDKLKVRKTCSIRCAAKKHEKIDWSAVDLENLILVQKLPLVKIGKLLGVSDTTVKEHAIKRNIFNKKKGFTKIKLLWNN